MPAKSEGWVKLDVDCEIPVRYLWIWLEPVSGVSWQLYDLSPLDWSRADPIGPDGTWKLVRSGGVRQSHCVLLESPQGRQADCSPSGVLNGYSRVHNSEHYGWVSDPAQSLPQWIELAFPTPTTIGTVHLTFDTDMTNPSFLSPLIPYVPQCVSAYDLEGLVGSEWMTLASEEDNFHVIGSITSRPTQSPSSGSRCAGRAAIHRPASSRCAHTDRGRSSTERT